jgi:two-component system LytT family response regulator
MNTQDPRRIRALIVDDEALARKRIKTLLANDSGIEVIGECSDGEKAVEAIHALAPDLVFLDVQMPVMNGFDVIRSIGSDRIPAIIFVTAYDQYALEAFEVHAVDYLLKPFNRARFEKTVTHVKTLVGRMQGGAFNGQLLTLLGSLQRKQEMPERFMIKSAGRIVFLRAEDIDWVETVGNYVRLRVGRDSHLMRETMNGMELKLDPQKFLRIHRSIIVNIDRVKELQPWAKGEYVVIMRDGARLNMSRRYRERLHKLMSKCAANPS